MHTVLPAMVTEILTGGGTPQLWIKQSGFESWPENCVVFLDKTI